MVNHLGNWKNGELGDFVTLKRGFDLPQQKREDGQVPIFSSSGITGTHSTAMVKAPGVITGRYGTIGEVFYAAKDFWPLNTTLFVEDFHGNDAKFIYYFMKTLEWSKFTSASAVPGINRNTVHKEIVSLPDIETQRRIASTLSMFDEKIKINTEINDNLQQQAQALFKQWFVDNPDAISWKEGTFSNLIEKTISGDWGKDSPSGNNTEMVYCIRGADIPEVRAGNKGKMPTRYILPKNYAAKQLVDGDIVVEISGGSPTQSTGRAAAVSDALLARYDKGMVCTNFCKALKPRAGYSMYVYYYWQYLYDRDIFFSYENGTTGIKNLDINGFIETEPIVIAPEGLVEKFDAVCQTVFSKIYANGMENEHLALVRDTLLPKLMSGEIDVSAVQL